MNPSSPLVREEKGPQSGHPALNEATEPISEQQTHNLVDHETPSASSETQGYAMHTLDELRKKMEETIAYQQSQFRHRHRKSQPSIPDISNLKSDTGFKRELRSNPSTPLKAPTSPTSTNPPSYPFPSPIPPKQHGDHAIGSRRDPHVSGPRLARSNTKRKLYKSSGSGSTGESLFSAPPIHDFLPRDAVAPPEDPIYPSPNLYDLALALNADPGLDSWWANTVQILKSHYGAERATLTVPGDATDLENVPWGQKATYGPYTVSPVTAASAEQDYNQRSHLREPTSSVNLKESDESGKPAGTEHVGKRPKLVARHSFAGYGPVRNDSSRQVGASGQGSHTARRKSSSEKERKVLRGEKPQQESSNSKPGSRPPLIPPDDYSRDRTITGTSDSEAVVFQVPRSLELEPDPLLKRTGVVRLFGRRKPAILTREYTQDPMSSHSRRPSYDQGHQDTIQTTPGDETHHNSSKDTRTPRPGFPLNSSPSQRRAGGSKSAVGQHEDGYAPLKESYEEYEQIPQSPWSQSPAPSPAPLSKPDQNPFFSNPEVDEGAFASTPPHHDYSENQSLHAIGIDQAKTVIHIPLLHSPRSKEPSSNTLRFPVAIISLLVPMVPYPANLRLSLAYLLPHFTTSFRLAQQYSQLEKQLISPSPQRYGHLIGIGGTFSDANSELELVTELSGQVNYPFGEDTGQPARSTMSSPINTSDLTRSSSVLSMATPLNPDVGQFGLRRDLFLSPAPVAQTGTELGDGYFKPKRPSILASQQSSRNARFTEVTSIPPSPLPEEKSTESEGHAAKDPGPADSQFISFGMPTGSSRHSSSTSMTTQLHRELQNRPFSDTIAQLMLNSVPLHLFLAKPHTGEVIWTNAKFDAYRRSQPNEPRIRDPWHNVHSGERDNLKHEWGIALERGSQFTERVRVRRLHDESAYRWFIFRANPLISSSGELLYWIGSFLDVHEQHVTEMKAAQEREMFATDAKYRALANSIPQVVFEAAEYQGLISANEQWELYTGQSLEEAQNLGFAKYIHRDDLEKCGILLPPQVIPESTNATEFGHIMSSPLKQQAPKETSGSSSRPSPKRSDSLGEDQFRPFGRGVTPALEELVRRGVVSIQTDENGRDSYTTEIRFRSRKGDFRWHLVRLVKVETTDFGSGEASWYGTCTDINDRKILEKELNTAMQKLNKEMESKTRFFISMSHEIRTPLNGILGTIPFILDTELDNDQRRMLDTIQNSSTNLRELVDNILDVSKVEAGKMNIFRTWFHVRSNLEDAIDTIASKAIDKGLELNYSFDIDVPAMVLGDKFRIRQILINLIGNAIKFTAQGEIFIRCSIHRDEDVPLKDSELLLNFEVIDTGKGFSKADAERLMKRFGQIENGDDAGSLDNAGSGLGLFLSKQLVEMHGGRLTPSSKEGRGATFSFYVKVDGAPPPTSGDSKEPAAGDQPLDSVVASVEPSSGPSSSTAFTTPTSNPSSKGGSYLSASSMSSSSVVHTLDDVEEFVEVSTKPAATGQLASPSLHPTTYSILIICPFDYARESIKQHIEQVIPYDVPASVTTMLDVDDWKELTTASNPVNLSHVVLCIPDANDVREIMHYVLQSSQKPSPALVVISDIFLKRGIEEDISVLSEAGKKVILLPKPVRPSTFSMIFDPLSKRDLSKDRNRDMSRELNASFKNVSKMVKEVIGNKGYRVLVVEDDDTNRSVMLKYLEKVKLTSETASNGQECVDMVFSKEPGYYSLIICDIQMPVKDGYQTCREIRSWEATNHFPQIPIMALSANAMTDQIDDAARAGFNDYVTKPIKHNELGRMMMEMLLDSNRSPTTRLKDRKL